MKILRVFSAVLALLSAAAFSGCANMAATVTPGADLSKVQKVYVERLAADQRGVQRIIADQLNHMGFAATHGEPGAAPADVDAIVTYQDKWMWDITMYMLELNVQVRDAQTKMALASAKSYRPSLQRKSPEEMAKEVLNEIFKGVKK